MKSPALSVIVPVSRRCDGVKAVLSDIRSGLGAAHDDHEVLLVVDGGYPGRLQECRAAAQDDPRIRVLHFNRKFGEGAALQAGLAESRAPVLLTYPAYFQVVPDVIVELLGALDGGADFAFASRLGRSDSVITKAQRWCFNKLVRSLLGLEYRDLACGVRAMRREVIEDIASHGTFHRFITVAAAMSGFDVREVDADRHPRASKIRIYSPLTYLRRLLDILNVFFVTKFLHKPLRFFGAVGMMLFIPGFLTCLWMSGLKIFGDVTLGERPLFLFGVILTVLGFEIVAIGLLGELISFAQARRKRPYAIKEIYRKEPTSSPANTTVAGEHSASP